MKKARPVVLILILLTAALAGCVGNEPEPFVAGSEINLVSREDGSGTRSAFVELFGIVQPDEDGNMVDRTSPEASITNSTAVVMTSVAGNPYAIGYISLGSMNETVKALAVNGTEAAPENVKNGSYEIARPFNAVLGAEASDAAVEFLDYILSREGQQVVEASGYISAVEEAPPFAGHRSAGKVVVGGSSSVAPVMEKLKEAYAVVNPNVTVEVQQSDSTTGMTSVAAGICDIGMASRALKGSEREKGLEPTVIAIDGIVVVVNHANPLQNVGGEQVQQMFTGEVTAWQEILEQNG